MRIIPIDGNNGNNDKNVNNGNNHRLNPLSEVKTVLGAYFALIILPIIIIGIAAVIYYTSGKKNNQPQGDIEKPENSATDGGR